MNKKIIDDVVSPSQKRSIKDIPLPMGRKRVNQNSLSSDGIRVGQESINNSDSKKSDSSNTENWSDNYGMKSPAWKKWSILGGIVFVLVAIFLILNSFHSVNLTIKAKTANANIDKKVEITDLTTNPDTKSLGYRIISLAGEVQKKVIANAEEKVEEKASGVITVFNNYSAQEQKLIKNTRFESEKGLIYRIQESVTVPGYKKDSSGNIIPGTLDVKVYADEAGEKYNNDSSNFTIPGFEGQPQYNFFSAKNKTAIAGGFNGVRKIITSDVIVAAEKELSANLTNKLFSEVKAQSTDDFVVIYNQNSFDIGKIQQEDVAGKDEAILKLKGSINAYVFNKKDLSNKTATDSVTGYTVVENVLITNLDSIKVELINKDSEGKEYLQINGSADFVWLNDIEQLKKDLAGKNKKDLLGLLNRYFGISKLEKVEIRPVWRSSFPENPEKIKVKTE